MSILELDVIQDNERFRSEIASLTHDGKRKWVYARKPKGRFYRWRSLLSTFLLAFLVLSPFITVGGHQFILLDLMERHFVFFGIPFWPNDFYLVALMFLVGVVSIVVFTATLGRIWCGWLCPQTVFLEMVFRKLEWLIEGSPQMQVRRNTGPWNWDRVWRFGTKHTLYVAISFIIANVFLAYFISSHTLLKYVENGPVQHIELFAALVVFTAVFYLVFARFREQACLIVCPYGRYMSALIDDNTVGVAYDHKRGEPRSKWRKGDQRVTAHDGHCIDCYACVAVCPTGIDIRNGGQLECVQCTGCIDACDEVMTKVGLPTGLIRYTSFAAIEKSDSPISGHTWLTPRIKAYGGIWLGLITVLITLFVLRTTLDVVVLRAPGTTWTETADGVTNFYELQIINKAADDLPYTLEIAEPSGAKLALLGIPASVKSGEIMKGRFMVNVPFTSLGKQNRHNNEISMRLNVRSAGQTIKTITTTLLIPDRD
jgi:cytochrome c oxidase accessory protein FixG